MSAEIAALNGFSGVLPEPARAQLRRAAATSISPQEPFARVEAIDRVVERLRRAHPDYFTTEGWLSDWAISE